MRVEEIAQNPDLVIFPKVHRLIDHYRVKLIINHSCFSPVQSLYLNWTNRKMVENPKRKLLIVVAVLLLPSSAQTGKKNTSAWEGIEGFTEGI